MRNVCPIWTFDSNGILHRYSGEYKKWHVHGDTLYLNQLVTANESDSSNTAQDTLQRYQGEYEKLYINGDTLSLSSLFTTNKSYFSNTAEGYLITKSEDKNSITIELKHIETEYVYSLTSEQPYLHLYLPAFNSTKSNSN